MLSVRARVGACMPVRVLEVRVCMWVSVYLSM